MAGIFTTRIRHVSLTLSPFSAEQMMKIGQVGLDSIISRIRQAVDANDGPAPPLNKKYARRKRAVTVIGLKASGSNVRQAMRGRRDIRDWTFTGNTLAAAKVKMASENKATLGFITSEADLIATVNNRRHKQWGVSPRDLEAIQAAFVESMKQKRVINFRRSA